MKKWEGVTFCDAIRKEFWKITQFMKIKSSNAHAEIKLELTKESSLR